MSSAVQVEYDYDEDGAPIEETTRFVDQYRHDPHVRSVEEIKLNVRGKKKSIVHSYGCWEEGAPHVVFPQVLLFKLEAMIDEVINSKQWLE